MEKGAWRRGGGVGEGLPANQRNASGRGLVLSLAARPQAAQAASQRRQPAPVPGSSRELVGDGARRVGGRAPFSWCWRPGSVCGASAPSTGSFHARGPLYPERGVSIDSEPRSCSAAGLSAAAGRPLHRTASCGFTLLQVPFPLPSRFSPLQRHTHSRAHGRLHVHIFLQTHTCWCPLTRLPYTKIHKPP